MGSARPARRRLVMTQDRPTAGRARHRGARVPRTRRDGRDRGPRAVPHAGRGQRARHRRRASSLARRASRGGARARGRPARARRRPPTRSNGSSRPRSASGALDDRLDAVRAHVRATVREKLLIANPGYLPLALTSAPHAHRDLERQLAEGPAPPRRGVPRLRRRRRAVPPGDEALRQDASPRSRSRASATSRCTTGRASGTASRSCRASGSTNVH